MQTALRRLLTNDTKASSAGPRSTCNSVSSPLNIQYGSEPQGYPIVITAQRVVAADSGSDSLVLLTGRLSALKASDNTILTLVDYFRHLFFAKHSGRFS